MLSHEPTAVGVVADLSIRVPRSAPGDILDGTRHVLEAIDGVAHVGEVKITAVTPNLNDLFVEVTTDLTVALDEPVDDEFESVRAVLLDGFGIDAVEFDQSSRAPNHD